MMFRIILLTPLLFLTFPVNAEQEPTRIGYAYDSKSNQLLYTESHHEKFIDGILIASEVLYKDTEDRVFARKEVDFSNNKFMPEFSLKNNKTGHQEITRYIENEYEVIFSESQDEIQKDSRLRFPEEGISDAGFDNFIIEYWDELSNGTVFKRDFLIPSMMDFIRFRIYQDDIVDEEGESLRLINIEPNNFLVRAFAGTTKLYYDSNKPKLRKFDGVSNMRDDNGDNYKVLIKYVDSNQHSTDKL